MFTLNPDTPESVSANTLLAIISDPKSVTKHINTIKEHQDILQRTTEALNLAQKSHDTAKSEADVSAAKHQQALEEYKNFASNKEVELNTREATLAEKESRFIQLTNDFEANATARSEDFTRRENAVLPREVAVAQKEQDIRVLTDQTQKAKEFYETKVANLKDALRVDYVLHAEPGHIGHTGNPVGTPIGANI